ncbi:MAG: hypothetical protein AAB459_03935 [Patescibacteria group bacterium]
MTNGFIAFLLGAGVGAWVYGKVMRSSGNNTQSALTVAAIAGVAGFVLMLLLLNLIPSGS